MSDFIQDTDINGQRDTSVCLSVCLFVRCVCKEPPWVDEARCFTEIQAGRGEVKNLGSTNKTRNLASWLSGKSSKWLPPDVTFGENAPNSIPGACLFVCPFVSQMEFDSYDSRPGNEVRGLNILLLQLPIPPTCGSISPVSFSEKSTFDILATVSFS